MQGLDLGMGVDVFDEHLFLLAAKKTRSRGGVAVVAAAAKKKKTSQPVPVYIAYDRIGAICFLPLDGI
jgi:hypothetical protein